MSVEAWFLVQGDPDAVVLLKRGESPGIVGDFRSEIRPGQVVAGLSYDEWRKLPEGEVAIVFEGGKAVRAESRRRDDDQPYRPLRRVKP